MMSTFYFCLTVPLNGFLENPAILSMTQTSVFGAVTVPNSHTELAYLGTISVELFESPGSG